MNTTQISPGHPPDILQTPPRHLQGTRDANRWQQTPTETKSQPETPQDTDGCCLSMSGSVSWRLLVSFYSWRWQGGVWGTCGGVWGVSEGIWVQISKMAVANDHPVAVNLQNIWVCEIKKKCHWNDLNWFSKQSLCPTRPIYYKLIISHEISHWKSNRSHIRHFENNQLL